MPALLNLHYMATWDTHTNFPLLSPALRVNLHYGLMALPRLSQVPLIQRISQTESLHILFPFWHLFLWKPGLTTHPPKLPWLWPLQLIASSEKATFRLYKQRIHKIFLQWKQEIFWWPGEGYRSSAENLFYCTRVLVSFLSYPSLNFLAISLTASSYSSHLLPTHTSLSHPLSPTTQSKCQLAHQPVGVKYLGITFNVSFDKEQ